MAVSEQFAHLITGLRTANNLISSGIHNGTLCYPWVYSPPVPLYYVPMLGYAFNRSAANSMAFNSETIGKLNAHTVELQTLATFERALRARYASPIRNYAHAAARLDGHKHASGVFGTMYSYVTALEQSGTT